MDNNKTKDIVMFILTIVLPVLGAGVMAAFGKLGDIKQQRVIDNLVKDVEMLKNN